MIEVRETEDILYQSHLLASSLRHRDSWVMLVSFKDIDKILVFS